MEPTDTPVDRFGWGTAGEIGDLLEAYRPRRILLVSGRTSYASSGAQEALAPVLDGYAVTRFSDFQVNPRIEDVERGVAMCRALRCDLVIGVGGGTALDVAKSVRLLAAQGSDPMRYVTGAEPVVRRGAPLIAIPTTAGSGSEATQFAVVYVGDMKHSLDHPLARPNHAIVDPALSMSVPAGVAAATGMDAVAHAIESFWSVRSNAESRQYAVEALSLAVTRLRDAVTRADRESRTGMARAAHLAGMAINITRTTACHALSYALTIRHGIPHGHAVALTLPHMLVFNAGVTDDDVADARGAGWVRETIGTLVQALGASDPAGASARLLELMRAISLETSLARLSVRDLESLVAAGFNQRLANNPRRLTDADVRAIFAAAQ